MSLEFTDWNGNKTSSITGDVPDHVNVQVFIRNNNERSRNLSQSEDQINPTHELNDMLRSIKEPFRGLQFMQENIINMRNSELSHQRVKTDIPIPTFYNEYDSNHMEFIWELEQHLEVKNIPCDAKALIIKSALKGRATAWCFVNI